ncbi:MAG: dihydrodipicolinate synthase family protein [Bryobacteraceae bacterium]
MKVQGVFSVLPTPFLDDGSLDLDSLRRVIDLFMAGGVNGFTALGVTGEVARLNESERKAVLETVISQVSGRVPVVAGTTAEGLRTCLEYSRQAQDAGAAAVMVSPPRMPKLNSESVVNHYGTLSQALNIEIVVQDFPPISGFTMEAALLARIAREVPRAQIIKLEDPPTPLKTAQILKQSDGVPVAILGGLGGVYLLEELLSGAAGAMTGFAFPEMLVEIAGLFHAGRVEESADAFYRYVPLMRFEFQQGIGMALRKEMLRRRGVLKSAAIRAPGATLDAATLTALDYLLAWTRKQGVKCSRTPSSA